MIKRFLFILIPILALTISCGKFSKLVKSSDYKLKLVKAREYFDKKDYYHAQMLFDELIPLYKGQPEEEEIYFYFCYCNYNQGDFSLAGYHFRNFVRTFPQSVHAESCSFMSALCYYHNSPQYTLDQTDTKNAILELQEFVNNYPTSTKLDTANILVSRLRLKLETKYYEITKQYFHINDYKAAITSCNIYVKDYPDAKFVEEINYINIKANYLLAANSIVSKKLVRLNAAIETYRKFVDLYPASKWADDAKFIYESCLKMKENLLKGA
ncbi:MAG: outer membrane protein assembly factor BamD [Bacteroidia bacterium]|nr:outer membrane protein assembly factor BamD [Bacteroidia bacterium]